jgi:hypothetical protein
MVHRSAGVQHTIEGAHRDCRAQAREARPAATAKDTERHELTVEVATEPEATPPVCEAHKRTCPMRDETYTTQIAVVCSSACNRWARRLFPPSSEVSIEDLPARLSEWLAEQEEAEPTRARQPPVYAVARSPAITRIRPAPRPD